MLATLLLLQLAQGPCATPALCELVARAGRVNRTAGPVQAWSANARTEIAVLGVRDQLVEGTTAIEQVVSTVRWERDGPFRQHIVAFRSATTTIPGRLDLVVVPTLVPSLAGDRLVTVGRHVGLQPFDVPSQDSATVGAPHPLHPDHARHYRFVAADSTTWVDPAGQGHEVVRLSVEPVLADTLQAILFEGELWLERASLRLVRVRGRVRIPPREPTGLLDRLLTTPLPIFVDLQQVRVGDAWLPARQRFEWVAAARPDARPSGGLRVLSVFTQPRVEPLDPAADTVTAQHLGYALTVAPPDSLEAFRDWAAPIGRRDTTRALRDWDDVRLGPPGTPRGSRVAFAPRAMTEVLRYNRVEGVYLGAAVSFRPLRAPTGTELHAVAGYGFLDRQLRGDVAADLRLGPVVTGLFGGRYLAHANEFMTPFQIPVLAAVLARDNWDYVDRREVGAHLTWRPLTANGNGARLDVAWVRDDSVVQNMRTTPYVGFLRNVRGIDEGEYLRVRAKFDLNPGVAAVYVRNGVGARLELEVGEGDAISYQRAVGRVVAQRHLGNVTVNLQGHAGAVFGSGLPPQQLMEFGGAVALPGYQYKEFGGNVAALARVRTAVGLPFLQRPIPVGSVAIPSPLPAVAVGVQAGWSDVTTDAARRAMAGLGPAFDTGTGQFKVDPETGTLVPASVPTRGVRSSVDLRVTLFNDALGIGIAQPIQANRGPAIFIVWGQGF